MNEQVNLDQPQLVQNNATWLALCYSSRVSVDSMRHRLSIKVEDRLKMYFLFLVQVK